MKLQKYYFPEFEEDTAYSKDYIIEEMKEMGLTECKVAIGEKDNTKDYFWCRAFMEVCDNFLSRDESCGRECGQYNPKNGKSGCCRHKGYCLIPGEEFKLSIKGKLTKIQ